ncbi:MAG TPA: FAD-dependent oxidoreductase [Candidatus Dormibacteraeota bacterium]|nr:FAD-dependent oxidoreductase [Candidatus Dormibacteraeota bacterium]
MPETSAVLNLTGNALTPGAQRSWWLREALAQDPGKTCPPLDHDRNADVVIVGGGFTGLWTAYSLTARNPNLGIVVLEQDICGGGPSGRNGGFASGWWDELHGLVTLYGREPAVRACRAISASISAIGEFCDRNGIDAWFRRGGYMFAITAAAHERLCEEMVQLARTVGEPEELRELSVEEVRARCASPAFRGGAFMRDGAQVQPARLARGLRRVLLERGVTIHEGTPVSRLEGTNAITPKGNVKASHAVLAVNAWGIGWPQLNRRLVAWSSYIVLTAPAPERLAEIGWTGGELISDFRTSLRYFRTTPDGRIAFGGGGGRARRSVDAMFTSDVRAVNETADGFRLMFPSFADVPIEDAWGGPIDVSPTHLPTFGKLDAGNVYYAAGYTGNGVAPSHLAGQVLADLITGADTDNVRLPMVNARPQPFPPEPFRSWGAAVVRRAMIAKETAEERGRRPGFLVSQLARTPRRMGYLLGPD